VDPSREYSFKVESLAISQPVIHPAIQLPSLLRMPAEVLDLISDFIMQLDKSNPRPPDPLLETHVRTLQSLRSTCRQLVPPPPFVP
jgi:hypothetical protein